VTSGQVRLAWGEPIAPEPALLTPTELVVSGHVLAVPLADEEGTFGAIWLTGEQFTAGQQQALAVASYHLATALRGAAAQRKFQQAQAQLVQSTKMAAVGQLAAGIAHEINSPLGAITVALQSVEANLEDPAAAQKRLQVAQRAADTAQRSIEKLLYYSREGGAGYRSVDLNQVIQDTLEIFAAQIERDATVLKTQLNPVPAVRGNPHELQQVLVNLLLNARDAVKASATRTVTVSTSFDGRRVRLEVGDTGAGVSPELVGRIFEPFFTTKPVGAGTGLGLSVSQQLVAQHQGTLSVASQLGEGSRFCVALPPA
jgi:two-component system NtrC family sensor kinase